MVSTLTQDEAVRSGFNFLGPESSPFDVAWRDDPRALVIARKKGEKYEVSRVRDARNVYNEKAELSEMFETTTTLSELFDHLRNPERWKSVDKSLKERIYAIAKTPSSEREQAEKLFDEAQARITKYNQEIRARLEIELDNAMMAHDNNKPELFYTR